MKKLMYLFTLTISSISSAQNDWLDDMKKLAVTHNRLPSRETTKIMHRNIKNDLYSIIEIEKRKFADKEAGLFKELSYDAEVAAAYVSLKYHEGVERYLSELRDNKKNLHAFVKSLRGLNRAEIRLNSLQKEYDQTQNIIKSAGLKAKIIALQAQIKTKRGYLKAIRPGGA